MQGQTNNKKRDEIEAKQKFKDIQDLPVKSSVIINFLNKFLKQHNKVKLEDARIKACKELECSAEHFNKKLPMVVKKAKKFKFLDKTNMFIWKG